MATRPALTVYGRAGCHLCEEMIEALHALQRLHRFEIAVVDVDSDPELTRRHGVAVPVLMHGARELCRTRLEPDAVASYLAKLS